MINELFERYPILKDCERELLEARNILLGCFKNGNKLLIGGNGGSSADSDHIAAELMKSFYSKRILPDDFVKRLKLVDKKRGKEIASKLQQPLVAISLSDSPALNTSFANDIVNGDKYIFAQKVYALGKKNDVFLAISTSGNSENVINAAITAKALGMKVVALSGFDGGKLKSLCDVCVLAPASKTHIIQELHMPIYHWLCLELEKEFFGE